MEKKLPSVFANRIDKDLSNNERVYVSSKKTEVQEEINEPIKKETPKLYEKTIVQKINEIMKSKKNLYKIPVVITINNQDQIKYIIGKNSKSLITFENELIPIEQIEDIKIDKEKTS